MQAALAMFEKARLPYDLWDRCRHDGSAEWKALADEVAASLARDEDRVRHGYAEKAVMHDGRGRRGRVLLIKPFRKSDSGTHVREATGRTAEPPGTHAEKLPRALRSETTRIDAVRIEGRKARRIVAVMAERASGTRHHSGPRWRLRSSDLTRH